MTSGREEQLAAEMNEWKSPPAEAPLLTLYVAADGVQLYQDDGWSEAKCVTCYEKEADGDVVAVRMKRSGMRWSKEGSHNVLCLRVAWLNKHWDRLWDTRPLARAA